MATKKPNYAAVAQKNKDVMERQAGTVPVTVESEELKEPEASAGSKGGRPRTADGRIQFTLKVRKDVRHRVKSLAVDHDCTASDIVDALVDQFIDRLDWDKVGD